MNGFNWDIKHFMAGIKKEGGAAAWPVLCVLWAHTNRRGRCWVGVRRICLESGYSVNPVTKALAYLENAGAFVLVPYDKRFEEEEGLEVRQNIYELTGTITVAGKKWDYLYYQQGEVPPSETSREETSSSETKGSTPIKVSTRSNSNGAMRPSFQEMMSKIDGNGANKAATIGEYIAAAFGLPYDSREDRQPCISGAAIAHKNLGSWERVAEAVISAWGQHPAGALGPYLVKCAPPADDRAFTVHKHPDEEA